MGQFLASCGTRFAAGRQGPADPVGESPVQFATVGAAFTCIAPEATDPDGDGIVYTAALSGWPALLRRGDAHLLGHARYWRRAKGFSRPVCIAVFDRAFCRPSALGADELIRRVEFLGGVGDCRIVLRESPG